MPPRHGRLLPNPAGQKFAKLAPSCVQLCRAVPYNLSSGNRLAGPHRFFRRLDATGGVDTLIEAGALAGGTR